MSVRVWQTSDLSLFQRISPFVPTFRVSTCLLDLFRSWNIQGYFTTEYLAVKLSRRRHLLV
jgi:hypothetical protein